MSAANLAVESGASPRPLTEAKDRIAVLDGLRGFSIVLVVVGHLAGTRGFPFQDNQWSAALALLGVRVFFVISGFLITQLLLEEQSSTGSIRLGRFYFRRTLRIFVPYYAFLIALLTCDRAGVIVVGFHDLAAAATYTTNYNLHAAWPLAHTWSLSVEEQFYLLWPAALALFGKRRGLRLVALVIVAVPVIRLAMWRFEPALADGIGHRFETCADSLATGCLLAAARPWLSASKSYQRFARPVMAVAVTILVIAAIVLDDHPRLAYGFEWSFQNLGIAFLIDVCHRDARAGLGWLLSLRPVTGVGRMSYSIYLWQQVFLDRDSHAFICSFPVNLIAVAVLSTASYRGIERTALVARRKLERRFFPTHLVVPAADRHPPPASPAPISHLG